jgi:hypothetical protein
MLKVSSGSPLMSTHPGDALRALDFAGDEERRAVRALRPQGKGRLARAVPAIVKAERKEIHLPHEAPWLDDFMTELASFVGANDLTDDQVDALAYAVLAANTFQPPSDSGTPCLLTPGYQGFGGMYH